MEDHPAAYLVQQDGLNTTVQGVFPRLVVLARVPQRHHVVALLVEVHVQPYRVVGAATEAVVAKDALPGVLNQSHILPVFSTDDTQQKLCHRFYLRFGNLRCTIWNYVQFKKQNLYCIDNICVCPLQKGTLIAAN